MTGAYTAREREREERQASLFTKKTIRKQQMIKWQIFTCCIPGTNGLILLNLSGISGLSQSIAVLRLQILGPFL